MTQKSFVIFAIFVSFVGAPSAQEPLSMRISLDEAQARAAAASHRLAEARAREAAAQGTIAIRQTAERPVVALSAGYTRTNHVTEFIVPTQTGGVPTVLYPDVPNNYRTRLDLQWPIYSGGRTDALERAARAEGSAAGADVEATQADLRLEVARAFWALVTARATVTVIEQGVVRARGHLAEVRQRFGAGIVPPNEVASADAQESRQRMLLIEARNQRDMSSAELSRLIGADLVQPLEPDVPLGAPDTAAQSIDRLVIDARAMRDERRALQFR